MVKGLDKMPWKECERCSREFEPSGDRVPKVLKCGHTLCWGCIKHISHLDFIKCPFCKTVFVFSKRITSINF
ncbi:hypothetical protein CRE_31269 [Caenorhabditis remanei]|uniref:RING-type domain-containing protein n=1 Tax=Caenorhabditis remanei TaxID=31234 RepID=E3MLJ0_CAERE|nr:hypothetical protein CRE_31269 [Caenorhabditis remanei]